MKPLKFIGALSLRLTLAAVVLAGLAAMIWEPDRLMAWATGKPADDTVDVEELRFAVARRDTLVISLVERGALRATKNVKIGSPFSRNGGNRPRYSRQQATLAWLRPEGELVEKGDVIARISKKPFEDSIVQKEEALAKQEEQLEVAVKNVPVEKAAGDGDIASAQTRLANIEAELRAYRELEAPKKVKSLSAARRAVRKRLEVAKDKLAEVQRSVDEQMMGDPAQEKKAEARVESARKAVESAEAACDTASLAQKKFRTTEYPRMLGRKADTVRNAQLSLQKTRVAADNQLANQHTRVQRGRKQVEKIKGEIKSLQDMITRCEVKAPVSGRLLYGDTERGYPKRSAVKVGMVVHQGYNFMTIPDESVFDIDVYIAEEYRYRTREEAEALIRIEAIPDLLLEGSVRSIESFAKRPPAGGPPKYKAVVSLGASDSRMVSGMYAQVEIVAETVLDALIVPIEAVYNVDGQTVCYVRETEGVRERNVKTGKSSDDYVQILEGLEVGERVALGRPAHAEEEAREETHTKMLDVPEDTPSAADNARPSP